MTAPTLLNAAGHPVVNGRAIPPTPRDPMRRAQLIIHELQRAYRTGSTALVAMLDYFTAQGFHPQAADGTLPAGKVVVQQSMVSEYDAPSGGVKHTPQNIIWLGGNYAAMVREHSTAMQKVKEPGHA